MNNIPRSLKKSKNYDGSEKDKITEYKNSKQGLINQIKYLVQSYINQTGDKNVESFQIERKEKANFKSTHKHITMF